VAIKRWKSKNGRIQYPLPNCKVCGKRSNTSDKETAQMAKKYGRICHACTKKIEEVSIESRSKKKSIWQKIKEFFYD